MRQEAPEERRPAQAKGHIFAASSRLEVLQLLDCETLGPRPGGLSCRGRPAARADTLLALGGGPKATAAAACLRTF